MLAAAEGVSSVVTSGSLGLAFVVALTAGLVSFLSPCVLPLVPGYLSYVTGLTGADLARTGRGRVVTGTALFILGFSAVFVSYGALFGYVGNTLLEYQTVITRVLGVVTIALGVAFLGYLPGLQRDFRVHLRPAVGLAGAPMLGVLFGIGWTPCIGPTLGAVQALAFDSASAGRGALLTAAYCLGLGVPFVLAAAGFRRAMGAFGWVKQHYVWVMRAGGAMLVVLGLLLVSGLWTQISVQMRVWTSSFQTLL
ncbi:MAG: cytochrome c biogenesis CcdA family protein [Streptomycetales bacterium]